MSDKFGCIFTKITSIVIILMSLAFTPFQLYIGAQKTPLTIILLIIMSSAIFTIGWFGLLKTNNPITRYNPFSINKKWKNQMAQSMNENPSQLFDLDRPDTDEIRNQKINQILHRKND